MIPYPYYLSFFLIKQSKNNISGQPLVLSLSTLEKRIVQQFNDQVPIEKISQELEISIPATCKIMKKIYKLY
ncbi:MAG: hypothetical protein QG627_249 [Chlamydiota bacterium]|jgi:hypothetical protein|nr:hypothetical protein [Chlamydiota bacterium]